jgi:hypothetical protein
MASQTPSRNRTSTTSQWDPRYMDQPGDESPEGNAFWEMVNRDQDVWRNLLRQGASDRGATYDESDLEGVIRNLSYADNAGRDPREFIDNQFLQYDERGSNNSGPSNDTNRDFSRSSSSSSGGGSTDSIGNWLGDAFQSSLDKQNSIMDQLLEDNRKRAEAAAAAEAERKARADALYNTYLERSGQALDLDADDPIIAGQVDAFRAAQQRQLRDYIGDLAEKSGPISNLESMQRIANERVGQDVSGFQAQVLGRELSTRRAEIADALSSTAGLLSADQDANLRRELSGIDSLISQMNARGAQMGTLGNLSMDKLRTELQNRQFGDQLQFQRDELRSREDQYRNRLAYDYWLGALNY